MKVMPSLLVTQMKNSAMDSQQCGIQEDATCRVDSICCCNVDDQGDDDYTPKAVISSINVNNIDMKGTKLMTWI